VRHTTSRGSFIRPRSELHQMRRRPLRNDALISRRYQPSHPPQSRQNTLDQMQQSLLHARAGSRVCDDLFSASTASNSASSSADYDTRAAGPSASVICRTVARRRDWMVWRRIASEKAESARRLPPRIGTSHRPLRRCRGPIDASSHSHSLHRHYTGATRRCLTIWQSHALVSPRRQLLS